MPFTPANIIFLPVGIEKDGKRYREVHIDQMRGVDEDNVADRKIRNNGGKAITRILQRCIQAIPGIFEEKSSEDALVPSNIVREMLTPDRDFIMINIMALSMEDEVLEATFRCPECKEGVDEQDIAFEELDVYDFPDDEVLEVPVELSTGFVFQGQEYCDVVWRFADGKLQEKLAGLSEDKVQTTGIAACCYIPELKMRPDTEMARRLPTKQRQRLMEDVQESTPGLALMRDCSCDGCGNEWRGSLSVSNFINSGRAKKKDSKSGKRGPLLRKRS